MVYPKYHHSLAEQVSDTGALVSEFPIGSKPTKDHFPRRNRIITGLSEALLITEAAVRSGSLISARYAIEQNREVFAVPGAVNNPMAEGCNYLIQQGAHLATCSNDIIETMGWENSTITITREEVNSKALDGIYQKLLEAIPFSPIHIDEIQAEMSKPLPELCNSLLHLQIEGYLEERCGYYTRIR